MTLLSWWIVRCKNHRHALRGLLYVTSTTFLTPPVPAKFIYFLSENWGYFLTHLPLQCGRHMWKPRYYVFDSEKLRCYDWLIVHVSRHHLRHTMPTKTKWKTSKSWTFGGQCLGMILVVTMHVRIPNVTWCRQLDWGCLVSRSLEEVDTMCNDFILSGINLWVRVWLRAAQTERGNARGGATKKREISRTLLSINIHFSVDLVDLCRQ